MVLNSFASLGQTCTIDNDGIMGPAQGPVDKSGKFYVQNNYKSISVGVNCSVTPPDTGVEAFKPFYVSAVVEKDSKITLEPVDKVVVWFERKAVDSTMMSDIVTQGFTVDFTGAASNPQTVSYNQGTWQDGPLSRRRPNV